MSLSGYQQKRYEEHTSETAVQAIGVWDYIVIGALFAISIAIGLYFRFTGNRQKTVKEYLIGGQNMPKMPVVFSLTVTRFSAILILGDTSEVYLYGVQRAALIVAGSLAIIISAYVFLPVFLDIGGYSVNEYLQKRFGKTTRLVVSLLWFIQMVIYMAMVLYTPSLALSSITGISTELSVAILGSVCTLYSSVGGLKAVIWTDVFQAMLMGICLLSILIQSVIEVGSFKDVWRMAEESKRLEFFNVSPDLTVRYTFWNCICYGLVEYTAFYAINQAQVQRLLSVRNLSGAQSCLLWNILPLNVIYGLAVFTGLSLYAVFHECNPLSNESGSGIFKSDQLVPYFIVTRMTAYPALAGLCVAGIFSGSLSSLSSAINSLTTVVIVDFVNACTGGNTRRSSSVVLPKMISVLLGLVITGLAFPMHQLGGIIQTLIAFTGIIRGPLLGVFSLGFFTTRANEKGVLVGLIHGIVFSGYIGFSTVLQKYKSPYLTLSTEGCKSSINTTVIPVILNASSVAGSLPQDDAINPSEPFMLSNISFMWVATIGFLVTLVVGHLSSYVVECCCKAGNKIDPRLLSPIVRKLLGYNTPENPPPPSSLETFC